MKKFAVLFSVLLSIQLFAQLPGEPFNPMTANGARHIYRNNNQWGHHILYWQNPTNVIFNDVYISSDSNLVINLDPAVKVLSGIDSSKVFSSLSLELLGLLDFHTKYYWRVVEYNSNGFTAGQVWYFISQCSIYNYWEDYFSSNLSNYTIIQPYYTFWDIWPTNFAGGSQPELQYDSHLNNYIVTTYLMLNEIFDLSPSINQISFNHCFHFDYGEFTIGLAYSLDEGSTWIPFWQQNVTEDIPATQVWDINVPNENYIKLALFCKSLPSSSGFWYVDNLLLDTWLTVSTPPIQIFAQADSSALMVDLNWSPGFTVNPSWGYRLQRKNGLPRSLTSYSTITEVGPSILSYEDSNVQLDSIYTYRIQSKEGPGGGWSTTWSNEATAYVPAIVPVELISFSSSVVGNDITLNWTTATETNNSGFQVERRKTEDERSEEWLKVSFVDGNGTTTEPQTYSFVDENLSAGKYQYRLKQIDFDGTFEYSNIVEAIILPPAKFSLEQNYPNPFNPSTSIQYAIGSRQIVTLKVYDVLGNEVATLVNEFQEAGIHSTLYILNSTLPSGVYLYQLKAGSFIQTNKMILIK